MKKRILSFLLVFSFLLAMAPTALAQNDIGVTPDKTARYRDTQGHWAEKVIETWNSAGIFQGDGTMFYPDKPLSRGGLASVLVRLLGLQRIERGARFSDLPEDAWYSKDAIRCSTAGVMMGSGEKFRPNDTLTKEELVVAIGRALRLKERATGAEGFTDYGQISPWALGYVNALTEQKALKGCGGTLAPKETVTRSITVALLNHLAEQNVMGVPGAHFTGTDTVTEWEVNEKGLTMTVALDGYHFAPGVKIEKYRDEILSSIFFHSVMFNKPTQEFQVVSFNCFADKALGAYRTAGGYFPYLDPANNITVRDRFLGLGYGTKQEEQTIPAELLDAYPGVCKGIVDTLKEGARLYLDQDGNLVITCGLDANNGYFKNFTNAVPVVNGGVPLVVCDLLMSLTIPAEAIDEGIAVSTRADSYYAIREMKMHVEVWEYVHPSCAGQKGVFAFNSNIQGDDRNTSGSSYGKTYYVRKAQDQQLAEKDIRTGGTGGPNKTGNKLLKIVMDARVGPTQWAGAKNMSTFYTNLFRTTADAAGYSGKSEDTYTPVDHPEWLKVEKKIVEGGKNKENPYILSANRYAVNYSGDHRGDVNDPAPMWIFFEVPKVKDFSIDEDMTVYVNLIGGMVGGSGQSVTVNGQPAAGQDGRYSFVIRNSEK